MSSIPSYKAPQEGRLTPEMVADFRDAGVLILEDFVSANACQELREHTLQMIEAFDPSEVKHVFSAMEQTQLGDKYFEESGAAAQGGFSVLIDHQGHVIAAQIGAQTRGSAPMMMVSLVKATYEPARLNGIPIPALFTVGDLGVPLQ